MNTRAQTLDVVLVDSGGSNLGSVQAALARLGVQAPVTADWARISAASHVILPGVGAAGPAMARLARHGLIERLPTLRQPVLGVCVGMQLLFAHSEEADTPCLGILAGSVQRLRGAVGVRVPHMGWNRIEVVRSHPLLDGLDGQYAYFVHSFAAPAGHHTRATCMHGQQFTAVVAQANFCGAQFHPERSAATGARLLRNFLNWDGSYTC